MKIPSYLSLSDENVLSLVSIRLITFEIFNIKNVQNKILFFGIWLHTKYEKQIRTYNIFYIYKDINLFRKSTKRYK